MRKLAPSIRSTDIAYVDINGYKRRADVHDHLELQGFIGAGRLDAYVAAHLHPGDWAVDVGANVGLITAQMCRLVGPAGRVWAVEPIPRNLDRLHQLADDNRLAQLRVFEGALSNETGQASIRLPADHQSGWASFTASWDTGGTLTTPTWRLDELVRGEAGRISFLKVDVEGFEPQVLEGATETLKSMRPVVMCEFNDTVLKDAGTSSQELLAVFERLGYRPVPECQDASRNLAGRVVDLLLLQPPEPEKVFAVTVPAQNEQEQAAGAR